MSHIICFGEMLMRLWPSNSERLCQKAQFNIDFVGAEANVAVSLSRFGHDVDMVTTLPSNPLGRGARTEVQKHGINCKKVHFREGRLGVLFLETGAMFRPSQIVYDRAHSAFAEMPASEYDWDAILDGADMLHLCGINLAVGTEPMQSCYDAVSTAKRLGVKVSFDCNFRPSLWKGREAEAAKAQHDIANHADILFAGPRDMGLMYGMSQAETDPLKAFENAAEVAFQQHPNLKYMAATAREVTSADTNILTAFIAHEGKVYATKPLLLDGIVDRIGGGDAYVGGMLHQLAKGAPPQEMVDFAAAASGLKHTMMGDFNLTSEAEVRSFMSTGGGDVNR